MAKIQCKQMDACCGVYFLWDFTQKPAAYTLVQFGQTEKDRENYARMYYPGTKIDQAWVDKKNAADGREDKEGYRARIKSELETYIANLKNKKSYYLAILNPIEAAQIEDVLLDVGFEIAIPSTKNPTGSAVITYVCHLLPRPMTKKVATSVIPRSR